MRMCIGDIGLKQIKIKQLDFVANQKIAISEIDDIT